MPVASLDEIRAKAGSDVGSSEWIEISQQSIDTFADVTGDRQFIMSIRKRRGRRPSAAPSPTDSSPSRF
jgi:hypothetical protein